MCIKRGSGVGGLRFGTRKLIPEIRVQAVSEFPNLARAARAAALCDHSEVSV